MKKMLLVAVVLMCGVKVHAEEATFIVHGATTTYSFPAFTKTVIMDYSSLNTDIALADGDVQYWDKYILYLESLMASAKKQRDDAQAIIKFLSGRMATAQGMVQDEKPIEEVPPTPVP